MRICISSIHPRALSGQIDCLVGLARELGRLGHDVSVVSAFDEARLMNDRLALANGDRGALLPKLARIRRIVGALERRAADADVVHFNLPTPAFSWLADLLRSRVSAPVVVGYEAHLAPIGELLRPRRLLRAPQFYVPRLLVNNRLVARLTLHRADRYVVSSELQATELAAVGADPRRVVVIPNVVDGAKCRPCSRQEARWALGLPDGPLVAYLGHFNHVKGVDVLAKAFGQIARERPDARLVLAWSGLGPVGPVDAALASVGIADRVIRLGKVDVASLLAAADVVALPYRMTIGQAAFPGVVLETMAMGTPLVTSDLPLLRELVGDGQTALLCPPESPGALADQILRLLGDRALARRMSTNQRAVVAGRFDAEHLARRYEELYEDAIGEQAPVLQPATRGRDLRFPAVRWGQRGVGERARARADAPPAAVERESA